MVQIGLRVPPDVLHAYLRALHYGEAPQTGLGGEVDGSIPALPWNLPLLKGASIVGVYWGEFAKREPKANAQALAELAHWYTQGKVKPVIDQRLPMQHLPQAFARMGSRQVMGKLVMVNA